MAHHNVFEGNLLRLKALALEQGAQLNRSQLSVSQYSRCKTINKVTSNEDKEKILQAIEAVKNAIEIFEGDVVRLQPGTSKLNFK